MVNRENIALFDRYLRGEMSAIEVEGFEERLMHSASLKKEFEEYSADLDELEKAKEYRILKDMIQQMLTNGKYCLIMMVVISPKFFIAGGIAAAILLLILFNPFDIGSLSVEGNSYTISKNDSFDDHAEEIEEAIEVVPNDNAPNQLQDSLETIDSNPYGTCFLMNEEGYFFTVNHLVNDSEKLRLQQKDLGITFEAEVIYVDTSYDFAILKSNNFIRNYFETYPFIAARNAPELGDPVFSMGYPKKDIVYSPGAISSDTGYESDSAYIELSMPVNGGNSGGPVFSDDGELIAIITARNLEKQSVGYALKYSTVLEIISGIPWKSNIDLSKNNTPSFSTRSERVKYYRPYIFEVHE